MKIAVINGANLNALGKREPEIYGQDTLEDICKYIQVSFPEIEFSFFQSNHEGALIDFLYKSNHCDGIVINPGAFSHYSLAIADALRSLSIPIIEVHLSQLYKREAFRQVSVTASACTAIISGLGKNSYIVAIEALKRIK